MERLQPWVAFACGCGVTFGICLLLGFFQDAREVRLKKLVKKLIDDLARMRGRAHFAWKVGQPVKKEKKPC